MNSFLGQYSSDVYNSLVSYKVFFMIVMFLVSTPLTVSAQATTVSDVAGRILLQIEGTPPVWDMPPTKKSLLTVMNDKEIVEFVIFIRKLKTWVDDDALNRIDRSVSLFSGIEVSDGMATLVSDMKTLRDLVASELTAPVRAPLPIVRSTRPNQANFSHVFIVSSSLGNRLTDAKITVRPRDIESYRGSGRQHQTAVLAHTGDGEYAFNAPADVTVDYEVEIIVQGHVAKIIKMPLLQGRTQLELIHEDYIARCNNINKGWVGCATNPDRLVETFGVVERSLINSNTLGQDAQVLNVQLYAYLPEMANDGITFDSRYVAYRSVLDMHSKLFALTASGAYSRAAMNIFEDAVDLKTAEILDKLVLYGLGALVPEVEKVFDSLSKLGVAPETIYSKPGDDWQTLLLFASYQMSRNLYFANIRDKMAISWIARDRAFISALEQIEGEFIRETAADHQAFVQSFIDKRTGSVLASVLIDGSLMAALEKTDGLRAFISSPSAIASAMTSNLLASSPNESVLKAFLFVIAQMDRELFMSVPDNLSEMRSVSEAGTLHLMALRICLGLIYNETRVVLLNGDNMKWTGNSWNYSWPEVQTEAQAYNIAMARSSIQKIDSSTNMLRQIYNSMSVPKIRNNDQ